MSDDENAAIDTVKEIAQSDDEAAIDTVKEIAQELHNYIDNLGNSREYSLAKTKIEEAVMWAIKGVTG